MYTFLLASLSNLLARVFISKVDMLLQIWVLRNPVRGFVELFRRKPVQSAKEEISRGLTVPPTRHLSYFSSHNHFSLSSLLFSSLLWQRSSQSMPRISWVRFWRTSRQRWRVWATWRSRPRRRRRRDTSEPSWPRSPHSAPLSSRYMTQYNIIQYNTIQYNTIQ